jgi:hypothetical protein
MTSHFPPIFQEKETRQAPDVISRGKISVDLNIGSVEVDLVG